MPLTKLQREFLEHLIVAPETGMSDKEFGDRVGVSKSTLESWKYGARCPEFPALLEAARKEYEESHSIFGNKTFLWALEEAEKNYKRAKKDKDTTEVRKWWGEITKLSKPESDGTRIDYSLWTDEDLEAEVYKRGLSPTEEALSRLRGS